MIIKLKAAIKIVVVVVESRTKRKLVIRDNEQINIRQVNNPEHKCSLLSNIFL